MMVKRTLVENLRRGTPLENKAANEIERLDDQRVSLALTIEGLQEQLKRLQRARSNKSRSGFDCNNTEPYSSITKEPM